jgi:hypothetical protein
MVAVGSVSECGLYEARRTATRLLVTVMGLLDTLNSSQRSAAVIEDFADPRRMDWDIIPKPDRTGVSLHQLDRHQKVLVWDLIRCAVSMRTFTKILAIPQLEHVLRDYEYDFLGSALQSWRTSDSYFLTLFGRPGFEETWMLRFLGHHVCLNLTIVDQHWISATPMALGQQPTEYDGILKPLADDEQLAFDLLHTLNDSQRAQAIIHNTAPPDFVTRQVPKVGAYEYPDHYDLGMPDYTITDSDRAALKLTREQPNGINATQLDATQQNILWALINCYLDRLPPEIATTHQQHLHHRGLDNIHFAWAGAQQRGAPHYFRVHTDLHLIEAVNAVGGGNHLHTALRDLNNDFGHNLLSQHTRSGHHWGTTHLTTRTTSSETLDPHIE